MAINRIKPGGITDNTIQSDDIAPGTIANDRLAGSIANSKLSNSSITVSDGSNTTAISLGGTLTFSGTSNEVEVAESSGTVTVGLPAATQITTSLGVGGGSTNGVQISQGAIAIKNGGTQSYVDFYCGFIFEAMCFLTSMFNSIFDISRKLVFIS